MSQLLTLVWLKLTLLRNSLRSSKAVVNRIASVLGMLVAMFVALLIALGLGIAAYALSQPNTMAMLQRAGSAEMPPAIAKAAAPGGVQRSDLTDCACLNNIGAT